MSLEWNALKGNGLGAGDGGMLTSQTIVEYTKAQPFRPFRIHMASGQAFDIRHPEMIRVGKTNFLIFTFVSDDPEVFDEWRSASLMLAESVSHLEPSVA